MTRRAAIAFVVACTSCVVNQRPVERPADDDAVVLVGSAALPNPIDGLARHPWIAMRGQGSASWERWEVMCCPDGSALGTVNKSSVDALSDHGAGGGDVRVHALLSGVRAEEVIACIRENAPRYPYRDTYRAWPGPNSNTFVDYMSRECGISVDLPAPSIGKDYRGLVVGVSTTAGGTGVQLETPVIGAKLVVPVGPGRIGFDDR